MSSHPQLGIGASSGRVVLDFPSGQVSLGDNDSGRMLEFLKSALAGELSAPLSDTIGSIQAQNNLGYVTLEASREAIDINKNELPKLMSALQNAIQQAF